MKAWRILWFAAALVTLLVVPTASFAQEATDRPFQAVLTGAAHWGFPGVSESNCSVATTFTEATGQVTHLGRVETSWSHCPGEPAYVLDGRGTFIAANGDMLFGKYDYDPTSKNPTIAITWTGGTGRFARASGSVVSTYTVVQQFIPGCDPVPDPFPCFDFSVPWPWSATLTGTITY